MELLANLSGTPELKVTCLSPISPVNGLLLVHTGDVRDVRFSGPEGGAS